MVAAQEIREQVQYMQEKREIKSVKKASATVTAWHKLCGKQRDQRAEEDAMGYTIMEPPHIPQQQA